MIPLSRAQPRWIHDVLARRGAAAAAAAADYDVGRRGSAVVHGDAAAVVVHCDDAADFGYNAAVGRGVDRLYQRRKLP